MVKKRPEGGPDPKVVQGLSEYLAPGRQCTATSKATGERCKRAPSRGLRVCVVHGGATRRARVAAAKRIAQASGYAADMLVEFMADPDTPQRDRVQIAQDLLNRANVVGKTSIELEVAPWQRYADFVTQHYTREDGEDDLSESLTLPARADEVIDAGVVEDERVEALEHERDKRRRRGLDPELPPAEARQHERRADMTDDPRKRSRLANARVDARREYEAGLLDRVDAPKRNDRGVVLRPAHDGKR